VYSVAVIAGRLVEARVFGLRTLEDVTQAWGCAKYGGLDP
jgi:hypothetical protein